MKYNPPDACRCFTYLSAGTSIFGKFRPVSLPLCLMSTLFNSVVMDFKCTSKCFTGVKCQPKTWIECHNKSGCFWLSCKFRSNAFWSKSGNRKCNPEGLPHLEVIILFLIVHLCLLSGIPWLSKNISAVKFSTTAVWLYLLQWYESWLVMWRQFHWFSS